MRIDPAIVRALDDTGLPYEITQGGRHKHIRIAGRLAAVVSTAERKCRSAYVRRNTIAAIRRMAAELKESHNDVSV